MASPRTRSRKRSRGRSRRRDPYARFRRIDGRHDYRDAVPDGYVDYPVRPRPGGEVAYFNFALAKELGLIERDHPHRMRRALENAILDTFSVQIINEYDVLHDADLDREDLEGPRCMATRYLQLQHPGRQGHTSGDGRSIWNGQLQHRGVTWDIMSCGTGATRLSPATAAEKRFFQTGDPDISYGCGLADLSDGFNSAVMSGVFHGNGIRTERTLAVIEYDGELAITVRAGRNLLRPSHFFVHLKQGNLPALRGAVDYFITRQEQNGDWSPPRTPAARYEFMARELARVFARVVARFESDYIFCWLDWDGDNILADGGIIDYGSVRQFGLYHHEYRYDDVERFSTTIPEQCKKARYIVQTFAQIRDYLKTGSKRGIRHFQHDRVLEIFDATLARERLEWLLYRLGFAADEREFLLRRHRGRVEEFRTHHRHFECAKSRSGRYRASDGITWDAVFCMRDILRELPRRWLREGSQPLTTRQFLDILRSSYAQDDDVAATATRHRHARRFQALYQELVRRVARWQREPDEVVLTRIVDRTSVINRADRITGDAVLRVTDQILRDRRRLSFDEVTRLVEDFIEYQDGVPGNLPRRRPRGGYPPRKLDTMKDIVEELRDGM